MLSKLQKASVLLKLLLGFFPNLLPSLFGFFISSQLGQHFGLSSIGLQEVEIVLKPLSFIFTLHPSCALLLEGGGHPLSSRAIISISPLSGQFFFLKIWANVQAVQVLIKKLAIEFDFLRDFAQLALPRIIFQLLTGKVGGGPCFAARSSKALWRKGRKGRKGPKQYTSKSSPKIWILVFCTLETFFS